MIEHNPKRRGRPRKSEAGKSPKKSTLTLAGPIPEFINSVDCLELLKQYRGRGLDWKRFRYLTEIGEIPSYVDQLTTSSAGIKVRRFRWPEVQAWLDSTLIPAQAKGVMVNGKFQPLRDAR